MIGLAAYLALVVTLSALVLGHQGEEGPGTPAPPHPALGAHTAPRPWRRPHPGPRSLLTKNTNPGRTLSMALPIPGENGVPKNAIVHGACGQWWTGNERSHCGGCHLTYTSLTAFDRHRRGGVCLPPESVGLVAREKPYGTLWGTPAPEGGYAALYGTQEAA